MKKFLPLILIAVVAAGCSDRQAAQSAQVRTAQQSVNKILAQAQLPYVPDNKSGLISRVVWRQQLQDKAQKQLQDILDKGTAEQKVSTRRLSADLYDSAARQDLVEVVDQWTELSNQSALLLSYLQAVDRADAQVRRYSGNQSKILTDMNKQTVAMQAQSESLHKELAGRQAKTKDLSSQIGKLKQQTQKAADQSAAMREKAFSQTGAQRYKTYEQAAKVAIEANKYSADLQTLQAQLDVANSHLTILTRQLELSNEAVNQAQAQTKSTQESLQAQARLKAKAQQEKEKAAGKLDIELKKIVAQYKDLFNNGFTPAAKKIDQAIKMLDGTLSLASDNQTKRQVQLDLLARKISKLHLLALESSATGDWARKAQVIADTAGDTKRPGGALLPDSSTSYNVTAQSAANQNKQVVDDALRTASEANVLAAQLTQAGSDSDPITQEATELADIASTYTKQINTSKL